MGQELLSKYMDYIQERCNYYSGLYKIKKQDQQDVLQSIYLKILKIKKEEIEYEQAYINTLILNTYKDYNTSQRKRKQCDNIDDYANDIDVSYNEDYNHSLIIDALDNFKKTLSEVERNVLDMRIEDYSYNEIADELGITPANARKIFERIKKKLSQITGVSS
jgi:RNA polymerase sigma factor (sigma-70 family)